MRPGAGAQPERLVEEHRQGWGTLQTGHPAFRNVQEALNLGRCCVGCGREALLEVANSSKRL